MRACQVQRQVLSPLDQVSNIVADFDDGIMHIKNLLGLFTFHKNVPFVLEMA